MNSVDFRFPGLLLVSAHFRLLPVLPKFNRSNLGLKESPFKMFE